MDEARARITHFGVTGTSAGLTIRQQDNLPSALERMAGMGAIWQHNGDCIGADMAIGLLWQMDDGRLHLHPPTNPIKRAFLEADVSEDPRPYLKRNHDIVDESEAMIAMPAGFREEIRSGTWATIRYARKLGRPIMFLWPDGSVVRERWPSP